MHSRRSIKGGTFAGVIRAYLASPKFAGLSENTKIDYRRHLALAELPETLGLVSVERIRPSLVQAFLDGLADLPAKQRHARVALKAVEKFALVRDLLPWPITTGTEAPGGDGGYEPWPDALVQLAEREARPHIARVITLGANTGQRGSDLVRMTWADLEEYEGRLGINITQKKTGVQIWIPMTQELQAAVRSWDRRPAPLLLREDGHPWTRGQLSSAWLRERDGNPVLAPIAEAGLCLHGLRSTAVVRLRRSGATTGQIAAMVGMSEGTVNRYCRLSIQRENAIAAVHHLDKRTNPERGSVTPIKLCGISD